MKSVYLRILLKNNNNRIRRIVITIIIGRRRRRRQQQNQQLLYIIIHKFTMKSYMRARCSKCLEYNYFPLKHDGMMIKMKNSNFGKPRCYLINNN